MRGIMVHSLLGKGLTFEDAYRVASRGARAASAAVRSSPATSCAPSWRSSPGPPPPPRRRRARPGQRHRRHRPRRAARRSRRASSPSRLLAAAIDPTRAFEVAREIEEDLLRRGVREIDRHELRRLAYRAIHERVGPQAAERYLVWRRYQEPDKPVILLLGGATGAGKTALAQEVAHRLGIAGLVSTDSIRQIMRIMLSKDLVPAIHASSYDAWRALPDAAGAEDPVIEGFRAMATTVSVGVRAHDRPRRRREREPDHRRRLARARAARPRELPRPRPRDLPDRRDPRPRGLRAAASTRAPARRPSARRTATSRTSTRSCASRTTCSSWRSSTACRSSTTSPSTAR